LKVTGYRLKQQREERLRRREERLRKKEERLQRAATNPKQVQVVFNIDEGTLQRLERLLQSLRAAGPTDGVAA
jgi:hypothetical protein